MKSLLLLSLAAAVLGQSASAATLVKYDFNNVPNVNSPNKPSAFSPCVLPSDLYECCLTPALFTTGGPDGSAYRSYSGWDMTQYDPAVYFNRDALYQWPATLSFTVTPEVQSIGAFTGFSLDLKRANAQSPDTIMASIFWEDASGNVQNRNSGAIDISSYTSWTNLSFSAPFGTADLPTGVDFGGETFRVEIYAWGGSGALGLDNVTLSGDCAPVPEPGAALLLGVSGLLFTLRRRRSR
jgi:opacity protein-like surface antigen